MSGPAETVEAGGSTGSTGSAGPVRAGARTRTRLVALVVAAALLLSACLAALALWSTRGASSDELATAERLAEIDARSPMLTTALQDCLTAPAAYGVAPAETAEQTAQAEPAEPAASCLVAVRPDAAWYLGRPQLDAGAVRDRDALLLGLGLGVLAGAAGLLGGGWSRTRRDAASRALLRSTGLGAALGGAGMASLWAAIATALALRELPLPGWEAPLQVLRTAALTGLVALAADAAARRFGAVRTVLVAATAVALTLFSPLSVLDLAGGWIQGR